MKPYSRQASALWLGTRQHGKGTIHSPSTALKMAAEGSGAAVQRRGAGPAELIAAAHAASFTLSLAHELAEAGFRPRQIATTATVTMENLAAGWTLTQIELEVIATVPAVAECAFVDAALRAKANCPISRALNVNISMRARLDSQHALSKIKARQRRRPLLTAKEPRLGRKTSLR